MKNISSILDYINTIKGLPLDKVGRASAMAWLGFGDQIIVPDYRGNLITKNKYALHLQCPWRLVNNKVGSIIFASHDMFIPKSGMIWSNNFDWDVQGANLYDQKVNTWLQGNNRSIVTDIVYNNIGDLTIFLSGDVTLYVFICNTGDHECWRFFECATEKPHLVVTGKSFEWN